MLRLTILPATITMYKIWDIIFDFVRGNDLMDHISGYVRSQVTVLKMEINEDVSRVLSKGFVYIVIFFLLILSLFFAGIGLALYLNIMFDRAYAGFCVVAGIYLFIFLLIFFSRKSIEEKMYKNIVGNKPTEKSDR